MNMPTLFKDIDDRDCYKICLGVYSPIAITLINKAIWNMESANEVNGMPLFTREGMIGQASHKYIFIDRTGELYLGVQTFWAHDKDGVINHVSVPELITTAKAQLINMLKAVRSLNDAVLCVYQSMHNSLQKMVSEGSRGAFHAQNENINLTALIKFFEGKPLTEYETNLMIGHPFNAFEHAQAKPHFDKYEEANAMLVQCPSDYTKKTKIMSREINTIFKLMCSFNSLTEHEGRGLNKNLSKLFDLASFGNYGQNLRRDAIVDEKIAEFEKCDEYEALTQFMVKK